MPPFRVVYSTAVVVRECNQLTKSVSLQSKQSNTQSIENLWKIYAHHSQGFALTICPNTTAFLPSGTY